MQQLLDSQQHYCQLFMGQNTNEAWPQTDKHVAPLAGRETDVLNRVC